ncbi:hypothetical protein AHAS_Ahas17G0078300 [Arachis hypogaea]
MSDKKKAIVRDLGFGGLMHIPPLRVHHQVLRELANNFKLGENRLETGYGSFKITPRKIGHALGINATDLFPQKVDYKKLSEDDKYVLNNDCLPSRMDSRKRKKSQEDSDSDSESESTDETQSKKKKVVVEHSSSEEDQYYDGYSTSERYEIASEDLDELLRENDEKSAAEGENEADLRSTEGRYVSSEIIPDVNLGSDDPSSQGRIEQSSVNKPAESIEPADSNMMVVREQTPSEALAIVPIQVFVPVSQTTTVPELEETPETDFEPTPLLQIEGTTETTPEPPNNLKKPHPCFPQLYLKSTEDVAALMMMARTASYVPKTDPMPSFSLGLTDSSQEEEATQEGASTQEADRAKTPETVNLLEQLEDLIVSAMCLILNQKKDKVAWPFRSTQMGNSYHLKPIKNSGWKTTRIFAPVYYSGHWWLWVIDTRKRRFHILDLLHKKAASDERKQLNKFTVRYVISRMRAYASGEPLKKDEKEKEIKASYVNISGQKSSYDCAIYVMKWLELIEPENIKKGKYEWDDWKQDEVDYYRVEYASWILFSEMNKERDQAIRASNAIRLSKPSSVLLSPFCQINSTGIETA